MRKNGTDNKHVITVKKIMYNIKTNHSDKITDDYLTPRDLWLTLVFTIMINKLCAIITELIELMLYIQGHLMVLHRVAVLLYLYALYFVFRNDNPCLTLFNIGNAEK